MMLHFFQTVQLQVNRRELLRDGDIANALVTLYQLN